MLIAVGHIVGAIAVSYAVVAALAAIVGWQAYTSQKLLLQEIAGNLGVSIEELDKEQFAPRVLKIYSRRYSNDLLVNRVSDFCGYLRLLWNGAAWLGQVGLLLGVIWYTATHSATNAVYAWAVPGVAVLVGCMDVALALLCRLFTGRYPGEARQARKLAAEIAKERRTEHLST